MMNLRYLLKGLVLFIVLLNLGYANSHQENYNRPIKVGLPDKRWIPPYIWYSPCAPSKPEGYSVDLLKRVFKKVGISYEFSAISSEYSEPEYSISLIKRFDFDAATIAEKINTKDIITIPEPLYSVNYTVFIRMENATDFTTLSSLKDKIGRVHTIRKSSSTFAKQSPENFNKLGFGKNIGYLLAQLAKGEVDYVVASRSIAGGYLSRNDLIGTVVSSGIENIKAADIYIIMNRNSLLAAYFDKINNAIIDIKSSGEANLLLRKSMYLGLAEDKNHCVRATP